MNTRQGPGPGAADVAAGLADQAAPDLEHDRLWLALVAQGARCEVLERQVEAMERSKSWRLTAPLRAVVRRLDHWRGRPAGRPALQAASSAVPVRPIAQAPANRMSRLLPAPGDDRPRLLVDVTELALEDLGAGVQRVTRRILAELLLDPPSRLAVTPVRLTPDGFYCGANGFLASFLGLPGQALGGDHVIEPRAGDHFLGLDFCRDRAAELATALGRLREAGVPVALTVPDVLPLIHPDWFPPPIAASYEQWLRVLAECSDRALCISADAASALRQELQARDLPIPPQGIAVMCLGADLPPVTAPATAPLPARTAGTTRVLMVGTLEPRKGHSQALDAFEVLWRRGLPFELVVAGHRGWMVDALLDRLDGHPESGHRLHWIDGPDDRTLFALYEGCDVLLMASRGEGFGLPVAEAGRLGLGLVLRDLAVFREVAGDRALYFSGDTGDVIADAILAHRERQSGAQPGEPWVTWADCAQSLREHLALAGTASHRGGIRLSSQESL